MNEIASPVPMPTEFAVRAWIFLNRRALLLH